MPLPISRTRGFFEVLMPGIFLVLNAAMTIYFLRISLIPELFSPVRPLRECILNPLVLFPLLIVTGYPVGFVLRLMKTATPDEWSGRLLRLRKTHRRKSYAKDVFFYGNWMKEKCSDRLPAGAAKFYDEYWSDKFKVDHPAANTTFFNFCKSVVTRIDPRSESEIYDAEYRMRFAAGTIYALGFACIFLLIDITCLTIGASFEQALLPAGLVPVYMIMLLVTLWQFRFLRCKEVDTVFNACFANHKIFKEMLPTTEDRLRLPDHPTSDYAVRQSILLRSWVRQNVDGKSVNFLDLEKLVSAIQEECRRHPSVSSFYFAGGRVDHPYFMLNDKVAMGLSVLPEDRAKAAVPKRHPHQTEIIMVLKGSINLHLGVDGEAEQQLLREGSHYSVPEDVCHWISPGNEETAVYMFIKTNPCEEPKAEVCASYASKPISSEPSGTSSARV